MVEQLKKTILDKGTLIPMGIVVVLMVFTVSSSWSVGRSIAEFQSNLDKRFDCLDRRLELMRAEYQGHAVDDWSLKDMERWSYMLEKANRSSQLSVPDPNLVKNGRDAK